MAVRGKAGGEEANDTLGGAGGSEDEEEEEEGGRPRAVAKPNRFLAVGLEPERRGSPAPPSGD